MQRKQMKWRKNQLIKRKKKEREGEEGNAAGGRGGTVRKDKSILIKMKCVAAPHTDDSQQPDRGPWLPRIKARHLHSAH